MAVAKWTIRQRKWSTTWWSVGIAAYMVLVMIFYPTIRNQTNQLDKSFNQIPESAKVLITDTQDLFSPVGYMSSQIYYLMLPLIFSILTIGMGSSLLAKEENDNTLELLLSRPLSRGRLVAQKALAGIVIFAIVGAVTLLSTLVMTKAVNMDISLVNVTVATLYSMALSLLFGAIAYFIASLGRAGRLASIGVAVLMALVGYIVSSLAQMVPWLKWPAKFFPFHYYHAGDLLTGNYAWRSFVSFVGISIILGVLAWLAFRRRDLAGN